MTHTPGPWVYDGAMNSVEIHIGPQQFFEYDGKSTPVPMQRGQEVATITAKHTPFPDGPDPIAEANARLIAAAPELLEALKLALPWLENHPWPNGEMPAATKARAAIAKAKGE